MRRGRNLSCLLLVIGACSLGPDDLGPLSGLWWGGCCQETTLTPGIRWELTIDEDSSGRISGRLRATGLRERTGVEWEHEGRVSGTVEDDSVVLHLVYEDLPPHRFEGRRIAANRMEGQIPELGDVEFARAGH